MAAFEPVYVTRLGVGLWVVVVVWPEPAPSSPEGIAMTVLVSRREVVRAVGRRAATVRGLRRHIGNPAVPHDLAIALRRRLRAT